MKKSVAVGPREKTPPPPPPTTPGKTQGPRPVGAGTPGGLAHFSDAWVGGGGGEGGERTQQKTALLTRCKCLQLTNMVGKMLFRE
jgi:hypothetical protein